jgi:hypothetical protein
MLTQTCVPLNVKVGFIRKSKTGNYVAIHNWEQINYPMAHHYGGILFCNKKKEIN